MLSQARNVIRVAVLLATLSALSSAPVLAHRPYFEDQDIVAEMPWQIDDPSISTAVYATLESPADVDYFSVAGRAGEQVLVSLIIPQVEGQEEFAPTIAVIGPGLPAQDLPPRVARGTDTGAVVFEPSPGPALPFFEPFSRTSYWDRQEERVVLPVDGRYTVAVWHPEGRPGRYVFVTGDRELPGGDPAFPLKLRAYWTPVEAAGEFNANWWPAFLAIGLALLVAVAVISHWGIRRLRSSRPESSPAE
jgi:hypothetical protein